MAEPFDILGSRGTWEERLAYVVETMREISQYSNPHEMVAAYSQRMQAANPGWILSLSRRGVDPPKFVLARDSRRWESQANPWRERDKLPVLEGGILGELVYSNEVRLIQDLVVPEDDPAHEVLDGIRSLASIPVFDGGEALNVVVFTRAEPNAFDPEELPMRVWMSNMFGRATHNLVLADELQRAYRQLDDEMAVIAEIQRSLLPRKLPRIGGLDLAAHYRPAARAGGDYYDFLPYRDGRWGMLIADVSGHGSPAAVEMAITRTLAHVHAREPAEPGEMLRYLNLNLTPRLSRLRGAFVTAWYGVYDEGQRSLRYACAGHLPPRLKRCSDGTLFELEAPGAPPLGVLPDQKFGEGEQELVEGDQMVLFTDGITEAFNPKREMFGLGRLDETLHDCGIDANALVETVVETLDTFVEGRELADDVTLLVAKVKAGA